MLRAVLIALLVLAGRGLGQTGQPGIRVTVKSEAAPVGDAVVTGNGLTVHTSSDGAAFLGAGPGQVSLSVEKDGFFAAHLSVAVQSSGETDVDVELQARKTDEEEVTVYATRTNVRLQDSPLHVEVVSQDEIGEELAMRPGDISMLLNEMGGMRVQTTSPGLGAASVRVQGMRGRYTAFLTDGLPLFGQQGAGLGLLQIPPMDLAQVEVLKGNASALYGSSALAGVVNLISRRPTKEPIRELLVNRSSLGETDGSMFLGTQLTEQWGASLLAGGYGQDQRDRNDDGWADIAGYSRGSLRPRFFRDNKRGSTALLTTGFTYEDRTGGTMPGFTLPATGQPYREGLKSTRYDLGATLQRAFGTRYVLSVRLAGSDQDHRHQFGEDVEKDRHDLLFGEVVMRGAVGKNTLVAGVAMQRDAYRPHDVPRFAYTYVVPGLLAQDDIEVAPWLSVSGSARLDFHNVYGTLFSPRLSVLLRKAGWTSRISAGQGFFAPTALTEETEAAGLARLFEPASLQAERGRNVSADLTRTLGPISVTGTFFASTIDHPVYVDRGAVYEIFNLAGPARNRGAEVLGTYRKAPFTVTATYTYVRTSELEPLAGVKEIPLTPRHNLGLTGMWEREGSSRIGMECFYTGQQRLEYNPYRAVSRPYVLVGAMGEQKIAAHVKLFLNLENLTDVRQTRWDPLLLPGRESDGRWTVDAWAPLDGRVINGGARFSF